MNTPPPSSGDWQADLNGLFATLDQEDKTFLANADRQTAFYHDTARPALEAAANVLRQHGRTAEVGAEPERVYLIISKLTGEVEFQYAVVAEVRIETVTPYIHCWLEDNKLAEAQQQEKGQPEKPAGDDDKKDDKGGEEGGDKGGEDAEKKDDKEPSRTKIIEALGTWRAERGIESVTQEEILADFVQHYQEAIALSRTQLHVAPPEPPQ